jgi:hypothetical protein
MLTEHAKHAVHAAKMFSRFPQPDPSQIFFPLPHHRGRAKSDGVGGGRGGQIFLPTHFSPLAPSFAAPICVFNDIDRFGVTEPRAVSHGAVATAAGLQL